MFCDKSKSMSRQNLSADIGTLKLNVPTAPCRHGWSVLQFYCLPEEIPLPTMYISIVPIMQFMHKHYGKNTHSRETELSWKYFPQASMTATLKGKTPALIKEENLFFKLRPH